MVIGKLEIQLILSYFLLKNPQTLRQVPLLFYNMNNGHFQQVAPMAVRIKDAAVNIEPVSYTHLDVYKRQVLMVKLTNKN